MKRIVISAAVMFWACSCSLTSVGTWSPAALPPVAISPFPLVLGLPGDKIGVFGGVSLQTGRPVAQTLLYDGVANRWRSGAPMPVARMGEAAVVLSDGEVLLAGGFGVMPDGSRSVLKTTYIYDARRDLWRRTGDLPAGKADAGAALLSDGRVLLVGGSVPRPQPTQLANGGITDVQDSASVEIFDPKSGLWSETTPLPEVRSGAIVAALPGARAIAAGGCVSADARSGSMQAVDTVDVYNASSAAWTAGPRLPEGRCDGVGLTLAGGRVMVMGGFTQLGSPLTTALLFDLARGAWLDAGRTAMPVNGWARVESVSYGYDLVFAPIAQPGKQQGRSTTVIVGGQVYDASSSGWSFVTSTEITTSSRFYPPTVLGAAPLDSGHVLVLLENAALIFTPEGSPPQGAVLDSASLTVVLLGIASALAFMILAARFMIRSPSR